MNTAPLKNFAAQSRNILKQGVLNRILALGFDIDGNVIVPEPTKIQGGTIFMDQLMDESLYDAWKELKFRIASHGIKEVCEEAAYTWFNRLVAIRIMQKNHFIEPVMQYANEESRMPVIVAQARAGRLTLSMNASTRDKLNNLLADPTLVDEQFALLIEAFCEANPVIYNCFGGIDKYVSLLLPDNILAKGGFIDLLNSTTYLTDDDYKQSELIGWLYQFYISEKKDEVFDKFKKGKKAEAEDIPAATQIFTPNWIVKYMVQNTLGRTYLDNNPGSPLADEMKYLVKDEPTPEEAILKIDDITGYKMIDPACGSGHILNESFDLLYTMYMEEFYSPRTAIENIFQKNLIGIDIDTRAKQLASFALLMKAASKDKSFLDAKVMPRVLDMPEPFVYPCSAEEFFAQYGINGGDSIKECVEAFELLRQANNLGSIMKFHISEQTRFAIAKQTAEWESKKFAPEAINAAIPSMNMVLALTDKYTAVVENPPYMSVSNMNDSLKEYVFSNYALGKSDLFSVFMVLCRSMLRKNGKAGMINMQSWMFITSFEALRKDFVKNTQIDSMLHLGPRTFDELSGEVVQNTSFVLTNCKPMYNGLYYRLVDGNNCAEKEYLFHNARSKYMVFQSRFLLIPGATIGYWLSDNTLSTFANITFDSIMLVDGKNVTGNNERFLRNIWEIDKRKIGKGLKYIPYAKGGGFRKWYGNNDFCVQWDDEARDCYKNTPAGRVIKPEYWYRKGYTYSRMSNIVNCRVLGDDGTFDGTTVSYFLQPQYEFLYNKCLGFFNSRVFDSYIRFLNPTIVFQLIDVKKVPCLFVSDSTINDSLVINNIQIEKDDWDAHETSWNFITNELISFQKKGIGCVTTEIDNSSVSQYFSLSLLVEEYKAKWSSLFWQLKNNEEELNRKFIEIYKMQGELTPDVPLNEITILQQGEISIENNEIVWHADVVMKQLVSYAIGCWMGRYRLDKEGLNIAYYPKDDEICTYDVNGHQFTIDDDGIIPLMPHQNPFEDDNALQKIVNFVKMVFGADNLTENLNYIEHCLGKSIEDYMMKDFWKDHLKMYQNRPIYWLFSSKKGAFQVLVYMHRMNPYTAEKVRTKYLLPYIDYLEAKIQQDRDRGADLSTIERKNLSRMEVALEECKEYHDRLHVVADKAIGFDLDDGVVVNYQKFGDVLPTIYKKKEK